MVEGGAVGPVAAALRRNGLITGADRGEVLEIEGNWTKRQETALQESLSKIKPGVNFWRLVAERVPGKNANDCFENFYSGRTATRAAKRFRAIGEFDFALTERNGSKRVKSLQSSAPTNVKTPGRETRATRQAAAGTAKRQSKTSGEGCNVALTERSGSQRVKSPQSNAPLNVKTPGRETRATREAATGAVKSLQSNAPLNVKTPGRETRATRQAPTGAAKIQSKTSGYNAGAMTRETVSSGAKGTKRRIEAASNSPDVKRIKATNPESKANRGTQRARTGSKNRSGKQVLIENRASAPAVALASVFERSSDSDGGESDSASRVSVDDDLWTQEQEEALQNAYATIKPSANFWHLISKRVPGRSADECFNKFYSAHPTPPRVPRRSGLKEVDCPPLLPRLTKAKTTGGKRLLEAHRTVRNILRKQQVDDEDYKADAFAALEPPDVVHSVFAMSKETEAKFCVNNGSLPGSLEISTTQYPQSNKENRKPKPVAQSREFGIGQSGVFSPEILKKVKDPLMLDKYIDHLHQRRTRRAGTKSAQRRESAQRARGVYDLSKNGLDFREVRLDAIHRAKQELRDVFLRPSSAVDDPFLNLLDGSSDGSGKDDEEDDVSVDTQ